MQSLCLIGKYPRVRWIDQINEIHESNENPAVILAAFSEAYQTKVLFASYTILYTSNCHMHSHEIISAIIAIKPTAKDKAIAKSRLRLKTMVW